MPNDDDRFQPCLRRTRSSVIIFGHSDDPTGRPGLDGARPGKFTSQIDEMDQFSLDIPIQNKSVKVQCEDNFIIPQL